MNYKGKKLLILGGISHMIDIVNTAKKMGIYTIVTDYSPDSPAKAIADKSYDVSTTDIDTLLEIAKMENIDGVINAFEDLNVWIAEELSNKLELPFYAKKEQLEIITNKNLFKNYCRDNKVPVIEEYFVGQTLTAKDVEKIKFPAIIKPVDSYGSRGIAVCYSEEELRKNYEIAIKFSKSKEVIIEKFINSDYGVEMYYTIQDKEIILSAMTDRYVYKQKDDLPPLPIATLYPSQHLDKYLDTIDKDVRKMLKKMQLENGVVLIQALVEEESFYIYEMAYRLTGEQHYQIVEKQTGINLLEMMIELALGGGTKKFNISAYDNSYIKYPACNLSVLLGEGKIDRIEGIEILDTLPEVISYIQLANLGDVIKESGNYSQMFIRINIAAENKERLNAVIEKINKNLKVISVNGENMIIKTFTYKGV